MSLGRAPVIATERLILRPHEKRDFEAFSAMWRDPVVLRYTIREARSPQDAWMTMHRLLGSWPLLGYGFWAVELAETGAYIGDIGFMDAMRPSTPDHRGIPEFGYAFAAASHGKGIASEAAQAVHEWLDMAMPGSLSFALIDDDNPASIRVAQKVGYSFVRHLASDETRPGLYERGSN